MDDITHNGVRYRLGAAVATVEQGEGEWNSEARRDAGTQRGVRAAVKKQSVGASSRSGYRKNGVMT